MGEWSAYFVNDPDDDFNLVVEIYYHDEDVAIIKYSDNGLILKFYVHDKELSIPCDWFTSLLSEAHERLTLSRAL